MIKVYYIDDVTGVECVSVGSYMDYSIDGKTAIIHDTEEHEKKGYEVVIVNSDKIIRVEAM